MCSRPARHKQRAADAYWLPALEPLDGLLTDFANFYLEHLDVVCSEVDWPG